MGPPGRHRCTMAALEPTMQRTGPGGRLTAAALPASAVLVATATAAAMVAVLAAVSSRELLPIKCLLRRCRHHHSHIHSRQQRQPSQALHMQGVQRRRQRPSTASSQHSLRQ